MAERRRERKVVPASVRKRRELTVDVSETLTSLSYSSDDAVQYRLCLFGVLEVAFHSSNCCPILRLRGMANEGHLAE